MLALSLGLSAALIWAVHDLLARKLAPGAALVPVVLLVLVSGSVALAVPTLVFGEWARLSIRAGVMSSLAGLAFALAIGALYRAFSMAPARIVSPIIGAYPMISLGLAVAQGRAVTLADWGAVLAVVAGIALVSLTASDDTPPGTAPESHLTASHLTAPHLTAPHLTAPHLTAPHLTAMGWSFLSACGFAATFAIGQEAARQASELPTILLTRLMAVVAIGALFFWTRSSLACLRGNWPVLAAMGVMDAIALSLVTASGTLPNAEYATVSASLFGVGTILLAAHFLNESLRPLQWAGVVTVFGGIATLSLQG